MKLSDTQLIILSAVARRDDHGIALPPTLKGGATQKVVAKLLERIYRIVGRPTAATAECTRLAGWSRPPAPTRRALRRIAKRRIKQGRSSTRAAFSRDTFFMSRDGRNRHKRLKLPGSLAVLRCTQNVAGTEAPANRLRRPGSGLRRQLAGLRAG